MPRNPEEPHYLYWCVPAITPLGFNEAATEMWILFRDRVQDLPGTGWTYRAATPTGPEPVAYRVSGEQRWKKWRSGLVYITRGNRKEELTEQEAVAIILMLK